MVIFLNFPVPASNTWSTCHQWDVMKFLFWAKTWGFSQWFLNIGLRLKAPSRLRCQTNPLNQPRLVCCVNFQGGYVSKGFLGIWFIPQKTSDLMFRPSWSKHWLTDDSMLSQECKQTGVSHESVSSLGWIQKTLLGWGDKVNIAGWKMEHLEDVSPIENGHRDIWLL